MQIINPYVFGGLTVLVSDTFTDTNLTVITAHTPDIDTVGGGWSVWLAPNADIYIVSNKAEATHTTPTPAYPSAIAYIDSGESDVSVTLKWSHDLSVGNGGIVLRYTSENDCFFVRLVNVAGQDTFEIFERNSTSGNGVRATTNVTLVQGQEYTITAQCSGSTITAQVDGGDEISYNSATNNQTATSHGFQLRSVGDTVDDFLVTTL